MDVTGILLPTPVLMPRCYVKVPETAQYVSEWDYHPDDHTTQLLSRAERTCCGGSRGLGDGVTARYIAPPPFGMGVALPICVAKL